jgi:predicted phosphate transport protein (TIGR00153 family)
MVLFLDFKKEKRVTELVIQHVNKVDECVRTAIKTVEAYLAEKKSEAKTLSHRVDKTETEADHITHSIRDTLFSGAYLPRVREDIHRLVESIDRVANAAENCCDFFLNQRPEIPDALKSRFLDVANESLGTIAPLKEAVFHYFQKRGPIEVNRQHAKSISARESNVDKLEWDLIKDIFTSPLDQSHKIHLKQCLNSIVEVSDRVEDAGDQFALVVLKTAV